MCGPLEAAIFSEWRPAAMMRREEPIPALSAGLSYLMMTGLLLSVSLPAPPRSVPGAEPAPQARVPEAVRTPSPPAASRAPSEPRPAAPAPAAAEAAQVVVEEWPQDEIVRAREQCMHLLASVSADVDWLEPIKKGPCGLPAPVLLKRVNEVTFDPPVHVNCRMVAALGKWAKSTLQPNAQERLKSRVVRIVGASGYSCRNIYNRPNARLSQHALANAIDIGGFALANGRTVRVLKGWGLTARDIKAQQEAKAKAEADAKAKGKAKEKAGGAKVAAAEAAPGGKKTGADAAAASGKIDGPDKAGKHVVKASLAPAEKPLAAGAKSAAPAGKAAADPAAAPKPTSEALFLRAIHGGACREFGTVLGPEANDPHRNHFHLDLIPRRGRGYCQ